MQAAPWPVLNKIAAACRAALGRKLTGIYVHGSIAFGCFNWDKSDIDLIVVTEEEPGQAEKEGLLARLLGLEADCPPKGVEMSVVLRKYCRPFHYPTPFELHYSAAHREKYQMDPASYCREMHGTDRDLAAHFTVIRAVGVTLCGTDKAAVFGEVPGEQYLDSIRRDVLEAAGAVPAPGGAGPGVLCGQRRFCGRCRVPARLCRLYAGAHCRGKRLTAGQYSRAMQPACIIFGNSHSMGFIDIAAKPLYNKTVKAPNPGPPEE